MILLPSSSLSLLLPTSFAQNSTYLLSRFEKTETMIPTRDGVRLHMLIYAPKDSSEPLPFIILRTPYSIDGGAAGSFNSYFKDLAAP